MEFLIIGIILFFILAYSNRVNLRRFVGDTEPYFRALMEEDYEFLLKVKYGNDIDVNELFGQRVRNGLVTIVVLIFVFVMSKPSFISVLLSFILGYVVFKSQYSSLQK